MGMSTHVVGFKGPDEKYRKMLAAWQALNEAGVHQYPQEMIDFFGRDAVEEGPDPAGTEVDLPKHEWEDDAREGYEIVVSEIPDGVTRLRFYNSW